MILRDRLEQLRRSDAAARAPAPPPAPVPPPPDFARHVPGYEYAGPAGRCFVSEQRFPADHRHGAISLAALLEADPEYLTYLGPDRRSDRLDLSRTAFLDTETTGLAGGTGTYAFLIGIGFYAPELDGFVVRQYFMRDYSEEPALLAALSELLAGFSAVVTYNGRAFDWPLIETRYRMNRLTCPLRDPHHLDLLIPARRVWRDRLASCALKDLEPPVLGVRRRGDVPGWVIPGLYFQYLRDRNPRPLRPVFSHNLLDILSLSTLAARLAGVVADPSRHDPGDGYGAGRLYEGRGQSERAIACYQAALDAALPDLLWHRCARRLSTLYKRAGRWPAAVALWERCLDGPDPDLFAHLELAKYYEHVAREYRPAGRIVDRALRHAEALALRPGGADPALRRDLEKRRNRLRAKLGRWS